MHQHAIRPYQLDASDEFTKSRSKRSAGLISMATGLGKTTVIAEIARREVEQGGRVVILTHRDMLVKQIEERVEMWCPQYYVSIEDGSRRADSSADIIIASKDSLHSRGTIENMRPTLIMSDECHHAASPRWKAVVMDAMRLNSGVYHLGLTATPHRGDRRTLLAGEAMFESLLYSYGAKAAIEDGWLAPVTARAVEYAELIDGQKFSTAEDISNALRSPQAAAIAAAAWEQDGCGQTLCFTSTIAHAEQAAEEWRRLGISAEAISGVDPERTDKIARYVSGETNVLCNAELLTEGVDLPYTDTIVFLRAINSWPAYMQMLGRGLRPLPGILDNSMTKEERVEAIKSSPKPHCTVLDIALNTTRHGMCCSISALEEIEKPIPAKRRKKMARQFKPEFAPSLPVSMLGVVDANVEKVGTSISRGWGLVGDKVYEIHCGVCNEGDMTARVWEDQAGLWRGELRTRQRTVYRTAPRHSFEEAIITTDKWARRDSWGANMPTTVVRR